MKSDSIVQLRRSGWFMLELWSTCKMNMYRRREEKLNPSGLSGFENLSSENSKELGLIEKLRNYRLILHSAWKITFSSYIRTERVFNFLVNSGKLIFFREIKMLKFQNIEQEDWNLYLVPLHQLDKNEMREIKKKRFSRREGRKQLGSGTPNIGSTRSNSFNNT